MDHPLDNCNVLLIDGPDATGKTTYAQWVVNTYPGAAVYLHRGRPNSLSWRKEHLNPVLAHLDLGLKVVMDRGPIGNPVWAEVFNDHDQALFPNRHTWGECMQAFADIGARAEVLVRDPQAIAATIRQRGEGEVAVADAMESIALFESEALRVCRYMPVTFMDSDRIHASINNTGVTQ